MAGPQAKKSGKKAKKVAKAVVFDEKAREYTIDRCIVIFILLESF